MAYAVSHSAAAGSRMYRGWWIVLVSGIGLSFSLGTTLIYTFGIFVKPLSGELKTSRGSVALAMSLIDLMVTLTSPIVGRLIDRRGARGVIATSIAALSLCLVGLSFLQPPLWHLYAVYGLAGFTGAATTSVGYSRVVAEWFDRQRGLALGLASSGLGLGAVITPLWAQFLIDRAGWRIAYVGLAVACLAIAAPVVWIFLKSPPRVQDEPRAFAVPFQSETQGGLTLQEALRTRTFWLLAIIFVSVATSISGATANLVPLLTDARIAGGTAVLAASALGAAMIVGRVAGGYLLDRFFAPHVAAALFFGAALGETLLWAGSGINCALLAAALLGFVLGAEGDLMPFLISRYFGMHSMAELYGYIFGVFTIGNAAGRYLFAAGFDAWHSYRIPLEIACVALGAAALISLTLGRYPSMVTQAHSQKAEATA